MSLWSYEYQLLIKDLTVSKNYKPKHCNELFVATCYNKLRKLEYHSHFYDKESFIYVIDQRPEYLHYVPEKFPRTNDMLDGKTSWTVIYKYNYVMIAAEHEGLHEELMKELYKPSRIMKYLQTNECIENYLM